jgi:hypothetical protein
MGIPARAQLPADSWLPDQVIYSDGLAAGWTAGGTAAYNLEVTGPVHGGSLAAQADFGPHERLQMRHGGLYSHGYRTLRFWIHGGTAGGQVLEVYTLDAHHQRRTPVNLAAYVAVPAGAWALAEIPLADLDSAETLITGIGWQEPDGDTQPTLYLDDVALIPANDPLAPEVLSWSVYPWAVAADAQTQSIVTAQVQDVQGDLAAVTLDLAALGGPADAPLYDDGVHQDGAAGDRLFGRVLTVPAGTVAGESPLFLTAADGAGHVTARYLGTFLVLSPTTAAWPPGLPRFLGWGNAEEDWQQASGLPWNYQSAFLTWGWQSWGPHYVQNYVEDAWSRGYVPVFTFDMLSGAADCGDQPVLDCDLAHLQDPTLVAAYLQRVAAAAQQAAGSQPVIFHVEPDGSAYMHRYSIQHDGEGGIVAGEPATIPAQSGDPDYPNTYAGFVQHVVDILHSAAPNSAVSLHARSWATGTDVAGDEDATLDVETIAFKTAHFLAAAGGPQLDLLFIDWKNYDAGSGLAAWWDDANRTWPHFNRMLHWANRVSYHARRRLVLWRVPAGNMSLDNTCTHYQDRKVDYAFTHSQDLWLAGIGGVVTGGGANCRTNPSTDGGNISARGAVYYAPPAALSGLTAGAEPGQPGLVTARWSPASEFDVWGYRLYVGRSPDTLLPRLDTRRLTSTSIVLPGGTWFISAAAYDARGVDGPPAPPVAVTVEAPFQGFVPLLAR